MLSAAGIEASRERPDKGTVIALRKVPTSNASNASIVESGADKGETAGNRDGANASSNARDEPNASSNASEDAAETAGSGNTGITGNRSGSTWKNDPMRFYPRGTVQ